MKEKISLSSNAAYLLNMLDRKIPNIKNKRAKCFFFAYLKCFKYLLLNKCEITNNWLTAGGNKEIINILKENGYSFEECLFLSVKYHRYELTIWLKTATLYFLKWILLLSL